MAFPWGLAQSFPYPPSTRPSPQTHTPPPSRQPLEVFREKMLQNKHSLGFVLHTYFRLFNSFTNICTLFRNNILY